MEEQSMYLNEDNKNWARQFLLLTYSILVVIITKSLVNLDVYVALVMFFFLLLPIFFVLGWPVNHYVMYIALAIFLTGKFLLAIYIDPLIGIDAIRYHQQVYHFPSFNDFIINFFDHVKENGLMSSSYYIYGIIYFPIYYFFDTNEPLLISAINGLLLVVLCYLYCIQIRNFFKFKVEGIQLIFMPIVVAIFLSPILMYYSSSFSKDIASLLSILLVVHLLLKKRFILAIIFLAYATALRPYSIVARI